MSEQRLIDANALPVYQRTIRYNTGAYELDYVLADDVKNAPTIDAVPREEHELLVRRLKHLLESDYIRSFDEVKPGTGEYKRDIREADLEHPHGRWGFRAYSGDMRLTVNAEVVCSNCHAPDFRVIGTWFKYCPHCGAKMDGCGSP